MTLVHGVTQPTGAGRPAGANGGMLRLDFYVRHMTRHHAARIELVSGDVVRFWVPHGERCSNAPIDHLQVVQLVMEAAPTSAIDELEREHRTSFTFRSQEAVQVVVEVLALEVDRWRVVIEPRAPSVAPAIVPVEIRRAPGGRADEALVGREEIAVTMAKASLPPPPAPAAAPVAARPGEPGIDRLLRMMVEAGASDMHLTSGVEAMVRLHGEMQALEVARPLAADRLFRLIDEITPARNRRELEETNDTDFSYTIAGVARFRANVFRDRTGVGAVFRQIPFDILSVSDLGLPRPVLDLCWLKKGLVLVTGPTGSGKSTTLATLVDYINQHRADHIITIEDPIEFVHANKRCLVNQREVGTHTQSFGRALRAALREDPDIVLVGEMRDLETISIALETAETGHLVFGTLHTTSAIATVDRIIDQFPPSQQEQVRVMLAESLRGVIAQVLCKKIGGGRVAAYEVFMVTHAASNLIREGKSFQLTSVMQTGKSHGMQTMNDHLLKLVADGLTTAQEAYMQAYDKASMKQALLQAGHTIELGRG